MNNFFTRKRPLLLFFFFFLLTGMILLGPYGDSRVPAIDRNTYRNLKTIQRGPGHGREELCGTGEIPTN